MTTVLAFSIRTKIFLGCISLTMVTVLVGILAHGIQSELGKNTLTIYDDSFQSMNYLRSAQTIILGISRDLAVGEGSSDIFLDQVQSALDSLDIARERAMSPRGEKFAGRLLRDVTALQAHFAEPGEAPDREEFRAVEQGFDMAVGIYAGDGFRLRSSAEALVLSARLQIYAAMAASVVTALLITLMLSRAIVPSIRRAVSIAAAIASGKLDNQIDLHKRSETGVLLRALASMQDSIAQKIACIESLMAHQASGYVAEIALQHQRFETALNHMTLGLCMFDAENKLLVRNKRFLEMFGSQDAGDGLADRLFCIGPPAHAITEPLLHSRLYNCSLEDGRTISIAEEAMAGGGRVVTYEDITDRQRMEAHLSHMARHDTLTGLPNRLLFREHLQELTSDSRRGDVVSVLCLDLDRFKIVNDTLGHPVGDKLLQETAARLLLVTDPGDTVVRLGGDEFAVVMRSQQRDAQATILAQSIIAILSKPFEIDGQSICVGVSIGVAQTGETPQAPDALLKNADLALYAAKAAGRGVYRVFESEMDDRIQERRRAELDLRQAIAEEQFELYYQPILSAGTGAVIAFEALVRWHHPERGFMSPADFIPLAEEAGLIHAIGVWVLNQACRDAREWPNDIKVAVNLSPLQFRCASLIADVEAALRQSGLSPTRLDIEITESLMLEHSETTLAILHSLRKLGIGISMDDFGTGYSSLSYLRRFPFDKIKIDRSFIHDLVESSDGLAIVKAVIQLGQSLRMNVVAEGVETQEQLNLLCRAGCQEFQGYVFSRPQPARYIQGIIEHFAVSFDHFGLQKVA